MGDSTVFAEVEIPPVVLLGHLELLYSAFQHIVSFFSLGSSDDFSYFRSQDIEGSYCLVVSVLPHIERFDIFGIVVKDNWLMEYMVAEISLMLGGEVDSPINFVLEGNSFMNDLNQIANTFSRISIASV
jgi:hypothetical protein